jgi:hypothetical protein
VADKTATALAVAIKTVMVRRAITTIAETAAMAGVRANSGAPMRRASRVNRSSMPVPP